MPVKGGVRRRRNKQPTMAGSSNGTIIEYSAIGTTVGSDAAGLASGRRLFAAGDLSNLSNTVGPTICSYYSTGTFLPGTKVRWEPSVSFTTTGRVYVGFTDNPEVMSAFIALATPAAVINAVKGLGDVISFPVWQETDITFPTATRRKMFDTNSNITNNVDVLDRSVQRFMLFAVEGAPATTTLGQMWYHDKVALEGIHNVVT